MKPRSDGRGRLTEKVQIRAKVFLGREISLRELRLMPYIQFVMMNNQRIDPNRINSEEREVLSEWRRQKLIEGGAGGLAIAKDFWIAMNEILWVAYVAYREENTDEG